MIVKAKVKTGQNTFSIIEGDVWKINVVYKPENNKANLEIIKELSKKYSSVKIVRGLKSKDKLIELR